ncbi:MAG: hypothetical protein H6526_00085 [Actinobacteria bacterium]|nr:hypothetical protein [Actinomycetota bacterium]MCB8998012.1 hypothetical protein [Actinomycetota bacterium]MCB9413664.1 hypothetical protein [Actinomycetota bacterium]MCB9424640.1 hypothetical protein [Actinomycetota bacterium]HRY10816.1 hypothetical protein [Candidatus Nanopelagicales bacterium]
MFRQLPQDDLHGRMERAFAAERLLTKLGWLMLALGFIGILVVTAQLVLGSLSWQRAAAGVLGILAATVLSGATAYGAGTNVGLGAVNLKLRLEERETSS